MTSPTPEPTCATCEGAREVCAACGFMPHGVGDRKPCPDCPPTEAPAPAAPSVEPCTTTDGHHFYRCVICEAVMDTPLAGLLDVAAARVPGGAAALRVRLDTLAARWYDEQSAYPDTEAGKHAASAVRCCINELGEVMEVVDPAEGGAAGEALEALLEIVRHVYEEPMSEEHIVTTAQSAIAAARARGPVGGEA